MKYLVIDERLVDTFTTEFETKKEALAEAEWKWNRLTEIEKKNHVKAFYVLESVNPDEEAEDHFDGNPIKIYK